MEGTAPSPLLPKSSVILFYYIPVVGAVGLEPTRSKTSGF